MGRSSPLFVRPPLDAEMLFTVVVTTVVYLPELASNPSFSYHLRPTPRIIRKQLPPLGVARHPAGLSGFRVMASPRRKMAAVGATENRPTSPPPGRDPQQQQQRRRQRRRLRRRLSLSLSRSPTTTAATVATPPTGLLRAAIDPRAARQLLPMQMEAKRTLR